MTHLRWQVGDITITRVEEALTYLDATVLMPDFTSEVLDPHRSWLVPDFFSERNDKLVLSIHTFVIEAPTATMVVDTCVGPEPRSLPGDPDFADRLDATVNGGLTAVDFVACTHMHFDHVGWNLRQVDGEQVPTFPSARYLFAKAELEHTQADDHMGVLEPSILPLIDAGLVDLVDTDHVVTDEIRFVPTPGHTPGHVSVLIESHGQSALITGDMAHSPLQFAEPDLAAAAFDADRDQSSRTRHEIIDRFVDTDTLVLGTHFAPPTAGVLRRNGEAARFETR